MQEGDRTMRASLYPVQGLPVGKISILARPRGGDWLLDEAKAIREAGVDVVISCLTPAEELELDLRDEAEYCQQQGIIYHSFPIIDRSVPPLSANTINILEQLHMHLSQGKHIALHCRQGLGRSVLMAASLLVLSDIPPDQAFDLLSRARGCSVPETAEQRMWVKAFAQHHHRHA
jgi:protein-tyrosine phosphatase